MAIYHYKNSPLLDRIEFHEPRPHVMQAAIVGADKADAAALEKLRENLSAKNFSTLMDVVDGRPSIQVRGLKNEKKLLIALAELGFARGGMDIEKTEQDDKKETFRDRVRGKAVFLSALFYDLGNAAFFVSGIQRGRHNKDGKFTSNDKSEMLIGAAFSVGDVMMTLCGDHRGDEELNAASEGLKRHLHRKGVELPEGDALHPDSLYQSGAFKTADRWIRKHVIHTKCLSEFAGGLFTIHSALKPGNVNNGKLAAGFLISTGWLATLLLDKQPGHQIFDGDKEPPSSLAGMLAENPRGLIARPLAMGNNLANLWGVYHPQTGERARFHNEVLEAQKQLGLHNTAENRAHLAYTQAKQHDYIWNVISAGSFLIAHTLFGLSGSKKRPEETQDDKSMMNDLVLMSANMLAGQSDKVRAAAIDQTADYVSKLSHVTLNKEQLAQAIQEKIDGITHSAWASRVAAKGDAPALQKS